MNQPLHHLANAPIEEAVIEIRVTPQEGRKVEELEDLCARVSTRYPKKMLNRQFAAHLDFAQDKKTKDVKDWLVGYRVETAERARVVQFNADLFSFSWLKPYDSWEKFVGEAREVWDLYHSTWSPTSVTRVGTRFVNRIAVPKTDLDFDDFFTAFPRIPPSLPQTLTTFLSRVVVPVDDDGTTVSVSLALEEVVADSVRVILDIDVAREGPNIKGTDMWPLMDSFRDLKNKAFFGSLTERALELFK